MEDSPLRPSDGLLSGPGADSATRHRCDREAIWTVAIVAVAISVFLAAL